MLVFVGVFILQWWSFTLYNIWALVTTPPAPVLVIAVIFINLGGIYNAIAYTIIRRKLQNQKRQNAVASGGDINKSTIVKSSGTTPRIVSAPHTVPVPGGVPEVLPDVLKGSSDVLDDPSFDSQVTEAWSVPIVPDSDAGEKQDADRIQIHIHI